MLGTNFSPIETPNYGVNVMENWNEKLKRCSYLVSNFQEFHKEYTEMSQSASGRKRLKGYKTMCEKVIGTEICPDTGEEVNIYQMRDPDKVKALYTVGKEQQIWDEAVVTE